MLKIIKNEDKIIICVVVILCFVISFFYFRDVYINKTIEKCRYYGEKWDWLKIDNNSWKITDKTFFLNLLYRCEKAGVDVTKVK